MVAFSPEHTKILHLEPTVKCNLRCPQCARTDGDLPNGDLRDGELTLARVKEIVPEDFVKRLDKMFMCGNYGEPAAAKDALEIYRWFRKINPEITLGMNTNGSLRTPAWWGDLGRLFNRPRDYVVWSIDGLSDTNHIYRRNAVWGKIIENARAFINAGGSAHWDMLVFQHNKHQVEEAEALAKELGCTWFRAKETFRQVHPTVSWLKKLTDAVPAVSGQISCQYDKEKTVYLSAHGEWMPCCYIASSTDSPGPNDVKVACPAADRSSDISVALGSSFVQDTVVASWATDTPFSVCKKSCSVTGDTTRALTKWKYERQLR